MSGFHRSGIAVALVALAALATGCCDKEKQQIQYLQDQHLKLEQEKSKVQSDLAQARTRESQLLSELDSKDLRITALQTENQDLRQRLTSRAAPPDRPGPGAEVPVYTETLAGDVLFEAGKATLSAGGKSQLNRVVSLLKGKYAGLTVRVYGYTDSDPIRRTRKLWSDNLDLSANRAMAVTRHLRARGLSAETIETVAMGATHFVASNSTRAGKAKNRRVAIVVVKK
jgi:outer membrane protein OmpA-like peptidoglycan-associated protein